ncbi:phosphonate metabolism transcriptional regulator PhnF [Palleronia sp.]|uniref:phosphonate metabolism transcriptional regulator PhnF n=1 Tax=Palleronia sp. TaxID=1940284 RepID=UPI0035C83BBD
MTERNWTYLREEIVTRIARGELGEGDRLPTEGELAAQFGIGRHSVRRAMAALSIEGLLSVEQGRGTFVRTQPLITYRIGKRTRFRENLEAQGIRPVTDLIVVEVMDAPERVAQSLRIEAGMPVHRALTRGRANGVPISLGQSFHEVARFPDFGSRREAGQGISEIYRAHGVADYFRRDTTIFARRPDLDEARLLEQLSDQPVMVLQKTDIDQAGQPIGCSESIWSGHRTRFSITSLDDLEE